MSKVQLSLKSNRHRILLGLAPPQKEWLLREVNQLIQETRTFLEAEQYLGELVSDFFNENSVVERTDANEDAITSYIYGAIKDARF